MPDQELQSAERDQGRMFVHAVRVPYADVDQMGVVYYANYFVYFEMARSELLREAGLPYPELESRGVLLPVVEAHCMYRRSAKYDDLIQVRSRCSVVRRTRLHIDYEIWRDGERLVDGYTEHVCMSRDGKVGRLTPELLALAREKERE